jgi:gas vesicle protein
VAEEQHTTAFVVGAILGGIAGAAATLWRVPQSGAQTRAQIAERVEGVLFKLTGMNKWQEGDITSASATAPTTDAANLLDDMSEPEAFQRIDDRVRSEGDQESQDDGATLPLTFRGEVLTEKAAEMEVGAGVGEDDRAG